MMYPNGGLYAFFGEVMGSNHHKLIRFYIYMTPSPSFEDEFHES